jgi:hypothetical protein
MERHQFKDGNYTIILYEYKCILKAYLHKKQNVCKKILSNVCKCRNTNRRNQDTHYDISETNNNTSLISKVHLK